MKKVKLFEQFLNEAKSIDRDSMIEWIEDHFRFVRTSEDFNGTYHGGIWVSGEDGDEFKGKRIYDYYSNSKAYELGVLKAWEKELSKRGWYSEWYDAGTVMIWPA
jgi:hypothetical protein